MKPKTEHSHAQHLPSLTLNYTTQTQNENYENFKKQKFFFCIHFSLTSYFNAFATGDFEKHIELQQINDAYMRRW